MSDILNVTVGDGKYTYIMDESGKATALRYGEPWPAFERSSPDNLHHALAAEVDDLIEMLTDARSEIDTLTKAVDYEPDEETLDKIDRKLFLAKRIAGGAQ